MAILTLKILAPGSRFSDVNALVPRPGPHVAFRAASSQHTRVLLDVQGAVQDHGCCSGRKRRSVFSHPSTAHRSLPASRRASVGGAMCGCCGAFCGSFNSRAPASNTAIGIVTNGGTIQTLVSEACASATAVRAQLPHAALQVGVVFLKKLLAWPSFGPGLRVKPSTYSRGGVEMST